MRSFAQLIERLVFTPQRNAKLRLVTDWLARTPDPDRGWGLAALTGDLVFTAAKPALIRALVMERTDPALFAWSYDYVGDLAETVALIWPELAAAGPPAPPPSLAEVVERLAGAGRAEVPALLAGWLDRLEAPERFALLKLITGNLRIGVSGRMARMAMAALAGRPVERIEELWHGHRPPYRALIAWAADPTAPEPARAGEDLSFRPLMLATPLEDDALDRLDPRDYAAEWKWDGIRVQLVAGAEGRRLYSRTGDDLSAAFPDVVEAMAFRGVADGELLVARPVEPAAGGDGGVPPAGGGVVVAPFNDLQQRLNRRTPSARLLRDHPAWVRLYDLLVDGEEDLRALPWRARRDRLEAWFAAVRPARMDLSPLVPFATWPELAALRAGARAEAIEGLMLKQTDSRYVAGRPKGPWFKWKRAPLTADCVMMYAQRGHGKRSSFYSDYTFGVWTRDGAGAEALVPVGKAYSGFTDEELVLLDRWVRTNTTQRFGPVREVSAGLVLEVAFDSIHPSPRHRSGLAMRFPRIHRIRWDKPALEADRLETLRALVR